MRRLCFSNCEFRHNRTPVIKINCSFYQIKLWRLNDKEKYEILIHWHLRRVICLWDLGLAMFRRAAVAMIHLHHHRRDLSSWHAWLRPKEPIWLPCSPATLAFGLLSVSDHVSIICKLKKVNKKFKYKF